MAISLSKRSVENLLDLVEIKIGAMHVQDRDDARELAHLEACRREFLGLRDGKNRGHPARYVPKQTEIIATQTEQPPTTGVAIH